MRKVSVLLAATLVTSAAALVAAQESPDIGRRPPREDCVANVRACEASGLSGRPGGRPGHSRCSECLDVCQGQHYWPDYTWDGKDCQWWNY
jgi:hypothetical protein